MKMKVFYDLQGGHVWCRIFTAVDRCDWGASFGNAGDITVTLEEFQEWFRQAGPHVTFFSSSHQHERNLPAIEYVPGPPPKIQVWINDCPEEDPLEKFQSLASELLEASREIPNDARMKAILELADRLTKLMAGGAG